MVLKASRKVIRRIKIRRDLKEYTYLGCVLTNNRSPWCFRMCQPNADGIGYCGRLAPHGFKSRIQLGIENYKRKQADSSTMIHNQEPTDNKYA